MVDVQRFVVLRQPTQGVSNEIRIDFSLFQSPADTQDLRALCEPYGGLVSVVIHRPANVPQSRQRNFGFVTFNHSFEADACVPTPCNAPRLLHSEELTVSHPCPFCPSPSLVVLRIPYNYIDGKSSILL